MQQESLQAVKRVTSGTRASKRLRREGRVPGVVYGKTHEAAPVHVSQRDLYAVLHTDAGLNAIIDLDIEGEAVLAVAREVQRHPVRGDVTHLDFIEVRMDTEIEAEVGIEYVGVPIAVNEAGAIIETLEASVSLMALPNAIPSSIEVNIEHLDLGDTLKLSDLPEVEGVTYVGDPEQPLLTVVIPAAEIVEPVEEVLLGEDGEPLDVEEGEEGEEADEDDATGDEG